MIIASFLVNDKNEKSWFFEKTFLLADINIDIAFEMLFLTLSNVEVSYTNWKLKYKLYTIAKTLFTIRQINLIGKKKFEATAFNPDNKIFEVHVAFFISTNLGLEIHLSWRTQIVFLKANQAFISVFFEYINFADILFKDIIA